MTDERKELVQAGKTWKASREKERLAAERTYAAIRSAVAQGVTESEAARLAGVDRMTVRRALGKL